MTDVEPARSRRVLITGSGPLADGLADGLRAAGHSVETRRIDDVSRAGCDALVAGASEELGGIDLVVHVQITSAEPTEVVASSTESWSAVCEDALAAALHITQAAHDALAASGRGRLVHVVPTIGMSGAAGFAASAAASEGIRALVKGVAKQWGADGITVNSCAVDPQQMVPGDSGRRLSEGVALAVPALGGSGDPATDLAPVISLLAGDDAHFVTGSTLVLDGGVWTVL
ncbi:MAG: SDR family oxidoreductase [Acidimicrobiales bacterium]|nr:SDR family oxidoreductase [Acidimicrobiales bacterium]